MNSRWSLRDVVCALYAWSAALFFGAVLIDVVYSSILGDAGAAAYGGVSDFLLLIGAPMALLAVAALALSWSTSASRILVVLSFLFLSLEFVAPFLFPLLRTSTDLSSMAITPYIRLTPLALASLLAIAAFRALFTEQQAPNT